MCLIAVAAHLLRKLLNELNGERRVSKRLHCNGHKLHGVIVGGSAVCGKFPAALASVYHRPLAVFLYPDRHRLHDTAAVGLTVSRLVVNVQAGQAVGTVISVIASRPLRDYLPSADLAVKNVTARVIFIVTLFVSFSFVFSVQEYSS